MISNSEFVSRSLELHLFFGRIMKEHSFFLQAGFLPRDSNYMEQADAFRMKFDALLATAVRLSEGAVHQDVLMSGEIVTPYTIHAEMVTSYLSGVKIPIELTHEELELARENRTAIHDDLAEKVAELNECYIDLVSELILFKTRILNCVLTCNMFTVNYPLLIDHILREANLYLASIMKLQYREEFDLRQEALEQEFFWNRIMAEHSKFIRGLLDPTEEELFLAANNFGNEFDKLTVEAKAAMDRTIPLEKATADSLDATLRVRDFNEAGTKGLINCQIRSIIIPLLGDHVLRESNHFIRLLKSYQK